VLNELTEKAPPGAGTASAKPPISEPPVNKARADSCNVQHVYITDDHIKKAMTNNITQGDFGTDNEVESNNINVGRIKNIPPVENSEQVNNESNNTNLLHTIQAGSFSKESNAFKFNDLLTTKGYNTRIELSMPTDTAPVKKYKVYIGFFASQEAAIKEAYAYTVKEKLSSYVIPSHVWSTSNSKINKADLDIKGVYIDYASIKQVKNL
jgi:hypothetical protein